MERLRALAPFYFDEKSLQKATVLLSSYHLGPEKLAAQCFCCSCRIHPFVGMESDEPLRGEVPKVKD